MPVGLNAVVYTNRKHLYLGPDETAAQVVPESGQIYFENDELSRKYQDHLRAAEHRLGNTAEIDALREEAMRLIGLENVMFRKILYSGSHTGDTVPIELISALSTEIGSIKTDHQSPELRRFLDCLADLIRAAEKENNPIVFV